MENKPIPPETPEIEVVPPGEPAVESSPEPPGSPATTTPAEIEATPQSTVKPATEEKAPEQGEAGEPAAPQGQPARRSWFYRFLRFTFSPETRLGRFMRPFLRWTGAIVGLLALGLMAGYFLLYQPTRQQLDSASRVIAGQNSEIGRLQTESASQQSALVAAGQRLQAAQDDLKKAQARNDLLVVIYDIANARTYLAQKDGAKVMSTLIQAQTDLQTVQPYLVANRKELADELVSRLGTVRTTVVRDPQLAQSDLDNLYAALLAANELLFE